MTPPLYLKRSVGGGVSKSASQAKAGAASVSENGFQLGILVERSEWVSHHGKSEGEYFLR